MSDHAQEEPGFEIFSDDRLRDVRFQRITNSILITIVAIGIEVYSWGWILPMARTIPFIIAMVGIGLATIMKIILNISQIVEITGILRDREAEG